MPASGTSGSPSSWSPFLTPARRWATAFVPPGSDLVGRVDDRIALRRRDDAARAGGSSGRISSGPPRPCTKTTTLFGAPSGRSTQARSAPLPTGAESPPLERRRDRCCRCRRTPPTKQHRSTSAARAALIRGCAARAGTRPEAGRQGRARARARATERGALLLDAVAVRHGVRHLGDRRRPTARSAYAGRPEQGGDPRQLHAGGPVGPVALGLPVGPNTRSPGDPEPDQHRLDPARAGAQPRCGRRRTAATRRR